MGNCWGTIMDPGILIRSQHFHMSSIKPLLLWWSHTAISSAEKMGFPLTGEGNCPPSIPTGAPATFGITVDFLCTTQGLAADWRSNTKGLVSGKGSSCKQRELLVNFPINAAIKLTNMTRRAYEGSSMRNSSSCSRLLHHTWVQGAKEPEYMELMF